MSVLEVLGVEDTAVHVSGLGIGGETSILDLKPYLL
jgi:tRNA (Thr-GGU) A37 N-methylase